MLSQTTNLIKLHIFTLFFMVIILHIVAHVQLMEIYR